MKRGNYGDAADAYTTGLQMLCSINDLCTALPPPRAHNQGFCETIAPNLDAWNFYCADPGDNGRMMV
eukprot:COSAG01_NODE_27170_length_692_cov_1.568297_1_plen_66_part_01